MATLLPSSAEAFFADVAELECDICKEPFNDGDHMPVTIPKCRHVFGKECLKAWIESANEAANTCPGCRRILFDNGQAAEAQVPTVEWVSDPWLPVLSCTEASPSGDTLLQAALRDPGILAEAKTLWELFLSQGEHVEHLIRIWGFINFGVKDRWVNAGKRMSRNVITPILLELKNIWQVHPNGVYREIAGYLDDLPSGPVLTTAEEARHAATLWQLFKTIELILHLSNMVDFKDVASPISCVCQVVSSLSPAAPISQSLMLPPFHPVPEYVDHLILLSVLLDSNTPLGTVEQELAGGDVTGIRSTASRRWNAICERARDKLLSSDTVLLNAQNYMGPNSKSSADQGPLLELWKEAADEVFASL